MRIGLLTDIHESLVPLRAALERFRDQRVDEIIDMGDVVRMTDHLVETVDLLRAANVTGTWGNHDFGLCNLPTTDIAQRYTPELAAYFAAYRPFLVRADCRFCHVEHWLDATDLSSLWYFAPMPETPEQLARSFDAVPQRVLFSGHVHRWYAATQEGPIEWVGKEPIRLDPARRWYVTLGALCDGYAALYDTDSALLTPLALPKPEET